MKEPNFSLPSYNILKYYFLSTSEGRNSAHAVSPSLESLCTRCRQVPCSLASVSGPIRYGASSSKCIFLLRILKPVFPPSLTPLLIFSVRSCTGGLSCECESLISWTDRKFLSLHSFRASSLPLAEKKKVKIFLLLPFIPLRPSGDGMMILACTGESNLLYRVHRFKR